MQTEVKRRASKSKWTSRSHPPVTSRRGPRPARHTEGGDPPTPPSSRPRWASAPGPRRAAGLPLKGKRPPRPPRTAGQPGPVRTWGCSPWWDSAGVDEGDKGFKSPQPQTPEGIKEARSGEGPRVLVQSGLCGSTRARCCSGERPVGAAGGRARLRWGSDGRATGGPKAASPTGREEDGPALLLFCCCFFEGGEKVMRTNPGLVQKEAQVTPLGSGKI